ncbi:MAG: hypothetical protein C4290_02460 [Chloroflexota bacterium]
MPIPRRYLALFKPELASGEQLLVVANADLWFRYRRLGLTDRRLIAVERGGLRRPWRGRWVRGIPLPEIAGIEVRRGRLQHTVTVRLRGGGAVGYALPSFSRGTVPFLRALEAAIARYGAAHQL